MKRFETNNKSFQVPENYFNQLEEHLLTEQKRFSDKKDFVVPENYFSDLEDRLISSAFEENKKGKVRKLWIMLSSVAACLVIVTTIIYPLFQSPEEIQTAKIDKQLEEDVYESLYDDYFEDEQKKSSNEISLDDLDEYYSVQQLSSNN